MQHEHPPPTKKKSPKKPYSPTKKSKNPILPKQQIKQIQNTNGITPQPSPPKTTHQTKQTTINQTNQPAKNHKIPPQSKSSKLNQNTETNNFLSENTWTSYLL